MVALCCGNCSLLFSGEPAADLDAADVDASSIDATPVDCKPFKCTGASKRLYHFDEQAPLKDDCDQANLAQDVAYTEEGSISGLGHALILQPEKRAESVAKDISGSWTLDFWIRPGSENGELLSVFHRDGIVTRCGLEMTFVAGRLNVYWDTGTAVFLRSDPVLALNEWSHVVFSYVQTGGSAVTRISVNGGDVVEASINACDRAETTLSIGDWDSSTIEGSVEGQIDEVRLQDLAVEVESCAP